MASKRSGKEVGISSGRPPPKKKTQAKNHGITFRDNRQRDRYKILISKPLHPCRFPDNHDLNKLGIKDNVFNLLERLGCVDMLRPMRGYENFTYEFLSSIDFTKDRLNFDNPNHRVSFRLMNIDYEMSFQHFCYEMGFANAGFIHDSWDQNLKSVDYQPAAFWELITGLDQFNTRANKASNIHNPVLSLVLKSIQKHLVHQKLLTEGNGRRQILFGRLLSEIFVQGKLLKYLRETGVSSDEELGTVVGKIINGKTLKSMKLTNKLVTSKEDLAVETVQSDLMTNFPSISKEDNPEDLYQFIKAHFELTGTIISVASIPDKIGGAPLKVKGKRSRKSDKDEVAASKPKKAKTAKTESSNVSASEEVLASEEVVQKQRNKEPEVQADAREAALQTIRDKKARSLKTAQERMKEAAEQLETENDDPRPKKAKNAEPIEMPCFIPTAEKLQEAREYATSEIAKRKQMRKQFEKQRDEQLKAAGYELAPEKAAVIATLTAELEEENVKEGVALLRQSLKGKHTSGASSEPTSKAPEAAQSKGQSSGIPSQYKARINIQIPDLPSPPSSSSTDSDNVLLSQHISKFLKDFKPTKLTADGRIDYEQTQIEFSQERINICERFHLPAVHFFQPPLVEPVSIQHPETNPETNHKITKLHKEPLSLEKHLGGEMQPTPTKASKTVPEKTVLENQQTDTETETQTIPEQIVSEHTVPEQGASNLEQSVPEQHVSEHIASDQQTTTEQPQPNTEQQQPESPTINLTSPEQQTASDQPSTSQTTIPEPSPIPDTILESEYIDEELIRLSDEIQRLILLRTVPVPPIHYLDQWMDLKKDFNELLDQLSAKCVTTHSDMLKKMLDDMHEAARVKELDYVPLLANTPLYLEDDYISRADRIQQGLRRRLRAKEEMVNKQQEVIKKQSEQIKYFMEQMSKLAKP
ncbi:hypothetical protein MTR_0016s0150 [Medicago truncatula]|uniref:Uncharacterized protein n=1 Tax=Medicago truncatula TaxID=3880 RepID=A0A072TKP7_MEDTR|nr:hypothetical protein MTR_0016s0150 [Medicago truncatula]